MTVGDTISADEVR